MRCLYKQNNDYFKRQNAFWLNINKKLRTNQVFKSFILIIMVIGQSTLFTFHNFLVTTAAVHIINDLNDLSVQKWRSCGLTEEKEISKLIIYCLNFRVFRNKQKYTFLGSTGSTMAASLVSSSTTRYM